MGCNNDYNDYGCRRDHRFDSDWRDDWDDFGTRRSRKHRRHRPNRGPEFGIFFGFPRSFR